MTRKSVHFLLALLAVSGAVPGASPAQLVTNYTLDESSFSPDGDGSQEQTVAQFTLSENSPVFSLIVFDSDSVTAVDTLVAPSPRAAGSGAVAWNGTDSGGSRVPEGLYLVTLTAQGLVHPDTSITLPVAVDITAPAVRVLLSEPGVYAPGLQGTPQIYSVTFTVTNTSPTYGFPSLADQLAVALTDPGAAGVELDSLIRIIPAFAGQDGTYLLEWDATRMQTVKEGVYEITLSVSDTAGHSAQTTDDADVDVTKPALGYINVTDNEDLVVAPDSLYGWAYDRTGIDSLYVKYADGYPYRRITTVRVADDTTFFAILLADSLALEGDYKLTFRAKDAVAADTGRVATVALRLTVDRTGPPAPALDPFDGVWRSSMFRLTGSWTGSPLVIRIYRDGAKIDSVVSVGQIDRTFDKRVALRPGLNVLTAIAFDMAYNGSAPSNEVRVTFDASAGIYIPAPFRPGDEFNVNLSRAAEVKLRIFDLAGDLVAVLTDTAAGTNHSLAWNGTNGDGDGVKKGPLVAVVEATYEDGTKEALREIFLFDPVER